MKYYDAVISLGQYCITSTALRKIFLQEESMIFDWSAGILEDICGKAGLEGKVNLICNDFENFFNQEDLENRGNNPENDIYNLWIVNKRTGLQYKHDFPATKTVEETFPVVKEKLNRRIKRLYETIKNSDKILFCFFSRDTGLDNILLTTQQEKLQQKFQNTKIDFLYIIHNPTFDENSYKIYNLTPNVTRIDMNFIYPTIPDYPDSWNGNTRLYYPLLQELIYTPVTIKHYQKEIKDLKHNINTLENNISTLSEKLEKHLTLPTLLEQIFSVKNEHNHKVLRITGIKMKFRRTK